MPKRFLSWRDTEQQLMTSITDQLGERRCRKNGVKRHGACTLDSQSKLLLDPLS